MCIFYVIFSVLKALFLLVYMVVFKDIMLVNTSHVEICSIFFIQFILCMGYPFMK